ncbi:MAG: hypothetical protein RLZZ342_325 [Candidatus Parcubacteria bacterium]|jgi:aspartyl-tRNA(Asn)/glutamyl-tRNA(Gln) amidotransferase subunit C
MSETPPIDIRALAQLARLELSETEVQKLEAEIPGILDLVAQITEVSADMPKAVSPAHRNVMRADDGAHETGTYTETLLAAAPARVGNQVEVKQVVSRSKSSH